MKKLVSSLTAAVAFVAVSGPAMAAHHHHAKKSHATAQAPESSTEQLNAQSLKQAQTPVATSTPPGAPAATATTPSAPVPGDMPASTMPANAPSTPN